ncbi:MFS transporter [Pikeienuella piscinae]|uniref:MFS transporter n=1 Tax=Pikeienuella piscinae TaxID=2748098 RepID=A0A7L5C0F2_9RHOB|nr:MFS transporter [Pikeienuella piscinae]QIE55319.1 MFS transporter [Pikeienuella piscinae]
MRLPPALQDPAFRLFMAGNFFSQQGAWAQRTIFGWLAWELSGSSGWVGVIAFLSFAPTFISGPVFGVMADRADLRRAAISVQLALISVSLLLFAALATGALTLTILALLAVTQGVTTSAQNPVRMALVPRLAPRAALGNAIAISALNFNLARLIGPAAGGYAIAHFGAAAAQAAVAALLVPMFFSLVSVEIRPSTANYAAPVRIAAALGEGAAYAWRRRSIRSALALTAVFAIVVRGMLELMPVIADGVFARGATGLGELMAAAGLGAFSGAFWLSSGDAVKSPAPGEAAEPPLRTFIALFGGLLGVALLSTTPGWWAALAIVAVIGFCSTLTGVTMQSVVQITVDDAHRGRVMSLWVMVGIGSASLGALTMGAAAEITGLEATLRLGAATGAVVIALLSVVEFQRRRSSRSSASRNLERSALEKGRPPPP